MLRSVTIALAAATATQGAVYDAAMEEWFENSLEFNYYARKNNAIRAEKRSQLILPEDMDPAEADCALSYDEITEEKYCTTRVPKDQCMW